VRAILRSRQREFVVEVPDLNLSLRFSLIDVRRALTYGAAPGKIRAITDQCEGP